HYRLQETGQVHRHLRPGPIRLSGSGTLAAGPRHRKHVSEPRYRSQHLAVSGRRRRLTVANPRTTVMATQLPLFIQPAELDAVLDNDDIQVVAVADAAPHSQSRVPAALHIQLRDFVAVNPP